MIVKINPVKISGIINAPTSKSSMQRACAAALLHDGETIINNPGKSNDDIAAIGIIKNLGAEVADQANGSLLIKTPVFESSRIPPVKQNLFHDCTMPEV